MQHAIACLSWHAACSLTFLVSLYLVGPAGSAEITVQQRALGGTNIYIHGFINPGDEEKFAAIKTSDPAWTIVWLNGPGGVLGSSIEIGRIIWKRGYTTAVSRSNGPCASACALIWFGGRHSVIQRDSVLIFHQAYDPHTKKADPEADEYVMQYYRSVGLTEKQAWELAHAAPPGPRSGRFAMEWWARELGFQWATVPSFAATASCQARFCLAVP